jgi:hypothetical protein
MAANYEQKRDALIAEIEAVPVAKRSREQARDLRFAKLDVAAKQTIFRDLAEMAAKKKAENV